MKTILLTTLAVAVLTSGTAFSQEGKPNPKEAIAKLMERAQDAKAAGRLDEARELASQAERIQHELREQAAKKQPDGPPGKKGAPQGKGPEGERLQHVMQAVEHLHAAGLHEPAKNIEEIARHLKQELEERMKHEHAAVKSKQEGGAEKHKQHAELEELRQQMRRMAEQLEQIQGELKKRAP